MADHASWLWYPGTTWPSYSSSSQNNFSASRNGLNINPNSYTNILWRDPNNDGVINDADTDDGTTAGTDRVVVNGVVKTVKEVGAYTNSTVVINGQTHTVLVGVWLFTDGTYGVRINDADIPAYTHHSTVTQITLGTWNNTEYSGSLIAGRTDPFLCFAAETLIETDRGLRPAGELRPGDRVRTLDRGFQPLRWIGRRSVPGIGPMTPVRIVRGALGNARDLLLSQQHRLLLTGWRAELVSGHPEVLAAARHLVNGATIRLDPCPSVEYVHLLFDRHEIVFSEGIPSESFHPAAYGLTLLDGAARAEVLALFPELEGDAAAYGPAARPCLQGWEVRAMAAAA